MMPIIEVGHKYYLIDKLVIKKNSVLPYDVYTRDSNDKPTLMHHKHMPLVDDIYKSMMDANNDLYVHEHEMSSYEKHFQTCSEYFIIPQKMLSVYNSICQTINQLFINPESMTNYKIAKEQVKTLVSTVLEKDYNSSSFLSILIYDYSIHAHSLNVCVYAVSLGKHLGLGKEALENLGLAAIFHDIGKSKINNYKNGLPNIDEFEVVKEHPIYSWNILKQLGIKNKNILAGVRGHHEKLDGSGYPDGLKGSKIHLYARIIGICNVFDALTTRRRDNIPQSSYETLNMMKRDMRKQLDNVLINHFILMLKEQNEN